MDRRLVFKDAQIVSANGVRAGDVLIEDHVIARIDSNIDVGGATEIPLGGNYLFPGVIDGHVHFREPGLTHKETISSGSAAAVRGGVTSYLEMPNTNPATTDQVRVDEKLEIAARTSYANYGFFIGATVDNIEALKIARRVPGIKVFMGSSTGNMLVDDQDVLERVFAETSLPIAVHAEEEQTVKTNLERFQERTDAAAHSLVRTPAAASSSGARACDLAVRHEHRLHVLHMSTRVELAALVPHPYISGEVCYPHLFLDDSAYDRLDCFAKINPPLRGREERDAMWDALRGGSFACVASDHAPHLAAEKERGYPVAPSGMPSVENGLSLMLDAHNRGELELTEVVRLLCEGPAAVWRIPNKGHVAEGYDADLVVVNLAAERTIRSSDQWTKAGWSAWNGTIVKGLPLLTMVMGQIVVRDDTLISEPCGQELGFEGQRGKGA